MIKQAASTALLGALLFAAGCDPVADDDTIASVTIDMRCDASTACPRGFSCVADAEHGPPTTMCESTDPDATCPSGYETKIGHGQTFCTPRAGARNRRSTSAITVRGSRAGRASDENRGF